MNGLLRNIVVFSCMSLFAAGVFDVNGMDVRRGANVTSAMEGQSVELSFDGCEALSKAMFGASVHTFSEDISRTLIIQYDRHNITFKEFQKLISKNYPGSETIKNLKVGDKIVLRIIGNFEEVFHIVDDSAYLRFEPYHLDDEYVFRALKFILGKTNEDGRYHVEYAKLQVFMSLSEEISNALKGIKKGNCLKLDKNPEICID